MNAEIRQKLIDALVEFAPGVYAPIRIGNLMYQFMDAQDVLQRPPFQIKRFILSKQIKKELAARGVTISKTENGLIKLERDCGGPHA